ncbi:Alpha/Beta hydrolase protein [Mucidula mucida]|nr:Alpha/Beta hydrolase protein [Mucidula mucida]
MSSERVYQIAVSNNKLLRRKIALCVFPDELKDTGWDYSVPLAAMRRLEAAINAELPRFTRDIKVDGFGTLDIHYVHQKSKTVDAIPLYIYLYMSGALGPSSFLEVRKMLPLLSAGTPSFHVVALSLPGFWFSSLKRLRRKGSESISMPRFAQVSHKVMMALSYSEYVTHGGDLGTMITRAMALKYGSKHVEARYFLQQSTRPQTLGYSLADSPVGLLAWLYEKLLDWTDERPTASTRIYYETYQSGDIYAIFPGDMGVSSYIVRDSSPISTSDSRAWLGGHDERQSCPPEGLVGDLRRMFGKGNPAFAVVSGRSGY